MNTRRDHDTNTSLTLTAPWSGTSLADAPYRARYLPDGARVTAQATTLIELLGNGVLSNLAELGIEDGKVPVGNAAGEYELQEYLDDPNGSLGKLAGLILAADKALVTDDSGNAQQIDLGTLGRALLALADGTNAQYVQGDATLQAKVDLPVSTATQTALNAKANLGGASFTAPISARTSIASYDPRQSGSTGATNTGGALTSGFTDTAYYTRLVCQEVVGTTVRAVLHVFLGTANQSFFIFGADGSLNVPGTLSKAGGTFLIDHPLEPLNKNLRHGFVESTEYINIYRGMVDLVNGRMTVDIDAAFGMSDGTFAALNADVMVSSLQNQYGPDRVWVEAPADSGKFTIVCEDTQSTATVAWMVTGRRNDAFVRSELDQNTDNEGRFIPEFDKEET